MISCPDDVRTSLDVSRETFDILQRYVDLLEKWNARINLVSPGTLPHLWSRHVFDSAQLYDLAPASTSSWADLGSGGGFPGVVIAILGRDRQGFSMTLVESDQRKAAFLRTALRECNVTATVVSQRIEDCTPLMADVLSARALAPLETLLSFAERHLAPDGLALFPKGGRASEEVAAAQETWSFACDVCPSRTDSAASILKIGDISRV